MPNRGRRNKHNIKTFFMFARTFMYINITDNTVGFEHIKLITLLQDSQSGKGFFIFDDCDHIVSIPPHLPGS